MVNQMKQMKDIYNMVLDAFVSVYTDSNITEKTNNSISIIYKNTKVKFKFRFVNGCLKKCFTMCNVENSIVSGVLYISDFLEGDVEAYNKNFIFEVMTRLDQYDWMDGFEDSLLFYHKPRQHKPSKDNQRGKHCPSPQMPVAVSTTEPVQTTENL